MKTHYRSRLAVSVGALAASLMLAGAVHAQVATSSIRGSAPSGAVVTARNVDTGFTTVDTAAANGAYVLPGLQPGTYEVSVVRDGQKTTQTVRVLVGQTARIDLGETAPGTVKEVVVTAQRPAADPTTSEVATSVTREQIDRLPQQNRNFINFAALAPGVRVSQDEKEVTFSAGGQNPLAINVFIDGQNQKGNIIDGGFTGQDDSRGNPFPQLGVQEFRVVTQNFKAEYEQSSSAIITAVTRSGTNTFHGEVFGTYQNENWVAQDEFSKARGEPKPKLEREQYGFAVGGPIIEDKLHYFATYEAKREDRAKNVFLGRSGYEDLFGQYEQTVATPFDEDLFFGKLSFQPNTAHRLDLSVSYRDEQDIRDVGGQDAAERANSVKIKETKANLRHQWQGAGWLNEAQVDYLKSSYNPSALNFTDFGKEYVSFRDADFGTPGFQFSPFSQDATIIRLGGRDSQQFVEQTSLTFKDDLTFTGLQWHGDHVVKLGAKLAKHNYYVEKDFNRNPMFLFDVDARPEIFGSRDIPIRVTIGSPVPAADVDNTVLGLFAQDDWQITDKLELNLGLRWDYENNPYNNSYHTPDNIKDLLHAYETLPGYTLPFKASDYITNGDRESFKGAFQPRIGFSYDVFGDKKTVIFGGAGRYYDRVPYNFAFDERFKPTQYVKEIYFSPVPMPGFTTWDPAYLTPAGLQPLLDAQPGQGEVFLVKNKAEPPRTDQFNFGLRQAFGQFRTSLTLSYAKSEHGFGWNIGNLGTGPDPRWNGPTPTMLGHPEFRNIIFISNHDQERKYKALFLTVDKPYTEASRWGMTFAYTLSDAKQNGSRDTNTSPFEFDYARTSDTPWYHAPTDERHHIVATGIVGLPWEMKLSGMLTLGSGTPYTIFTPTGPRWFEGRPAKDDFLFLKDAFATQQLDLRLTKAVNVWGGNKVEMSVDAINITDHKNYSDFESWILAPNFGQPRNQLYPTRSFQVGLRYKW